MRLHCVRFQQTSNEKHCAHRELLYLKQNTIHLCFFSLFCFWGPWQHFPTWVRTVKGTGLGAEARAALRRHLGLTLTLLSFLLRRVFHFQQILCTCRCIEIKEYSFFFLRLEIRSYKEHFPGYDSVEFWHWDKFDILINYRLYVENNVVLLCLKANIFATCICDFSVCSHM